MTTKRKYIDLTAISSTQAKAQGITCVMAYIACCTVSAGSLIIGSALPFVVQEITASTVWTAMSLGAMFIASGLSARWIKHAAILGDQHAK